jgi:hypothetical protein
MDKEHDTELLARVAAHDALGYTATALLDLDDSLLRYIFHMLQPLPDVFSMAQTCWVSCRLWPHQEQALPHLSGSNSLRSLLQRMRRVTHDKQRWLVVAPAGYDLQRLAAAPSGRTYLTLAAAVSASRWVLLLWQPLSHVTPAAWLPMASKAGQSITGRLLPLLKLFILRLACM